MNPEHEYRTRMLNMNATTWMLKIESKTYLFVNDLILCDMRNGLKKRKTSIERYIHFRILKIYFSSAAVHISIFIIISYWIRFSILYDMLRETSIMCPWSLKFLGGTWGHIHMLLQVLLLKNLYWSQVRRTWKPLYRTTILIFFLPLIPPRGIISMRCFTSRNVAMLN